MNILYEEEGSFKVGAILADNDTSLQVEAPHGKRSKVKASAVLLRFAEPSAAALLEQAQAIAHDADADFLWEVAGTDEIVFTDLAREYFGHVPTAAEAGGILMRLHGSPMHFYKKGKGHYKPAPEESLKAALASAEKKRQQAAQLASHVEQLCAFNLPDALRPHVDVLLYKPDRNTLECKALEAACAATGFSAPKLLAKCGAIASPHDFHLNAFLFEHFPRGTGFSDFGACVEFPELPQSDVEAFSIDDATTTEIDDAFSVVRLTNGNWRVGIHIAAPALGIEQGSSLDQLALDRASTVYMPGGKITMLPDEVVERFTLSEGKTCPALSMYLDVDDADFSVVATRTAVERVRITANLRHDTLEQLFNEDTLKREGADYPFKRELALLWQFADRLEAARGKQDPGRTPQVDYNFVIENDRVSIARRLRGNPIDKVVSELMIHVNSSWAKTLGDKGYPAIYRCQNNGKVRMSTTPGKHQGLGVEQYMWSSSPLRRSVDLVNQRQLIALTRGEAPPYAANSDALFTALRDFEVAHEAYGDFQRSMERYWCMRYIQQEGITESIATVIKENIVRFDNLPLTARVPSLPEIAPGTRVSLELSDIDLMELTFSCQFKHKLED